MGGRGAGSGRSLFIEVTYPGPDKVTARYFRPAGSTSIYNYDGTGEIKIPGGFNAFIKRAKLRGVEVKSFKPKNRFAEHYAPQLSREDHRAARAQRSIAHVAKYGRPLGAR